jgi:predicted metal-dependent HD superfamily phosphohydrolase
MSVHSTDLFLEAEAYVSEFHRRYAPPARYFHTAQHARMVFEQCETLASFYEIPWDDAEVLYLAAWFQNTGYCCTSQQHEQQSIGILADFLKSFKVSRSFQRAVEKLILSTHADYRPVTLLEKILKDADAHDVSSEHYNIWSQMRRQELALCEDTAYTEHAWTVFNIAYLQSHKFYTPEAARLGEAAKQKNLTYLLGLVQQ